jgi:predicted trehalose synthase
MNRDPSAESALDLAMGRLDRAVAKIEERLGGQGPEEAGSGDLFHVDRAKLAQQLDQARARERELEAAGAEASAALGRAIDEIHAALFSKTENPLQAQEG